MCAGVLCSYVCVCVCVCGVCVVCVCTCVCMCACLHVRTICYVEKCLTGSSALPPIMPAPSHLSRYCRSTNRLGVVTHTQACNTLHHSYICHSFILLAARIRKRCIYHIRIQVLDCLQCKLYTIEIYLIDSFLFYIVTTPCFLIK